MHPKTRLKGPLGKVDDVIVSVFRYISYVSAVCLVGIMLVAFLNVLGEKLLHQGIPSSTEIIKYLHVPMVFLAGAFVTLDRGQTTIDLLWQHFPKAVKKLTSTVSFLLGTAICAFVGARGVYLMVNTHIKNHTMSSTTGIGFPLWPFSLLFALGFFMLALSFLWSIVRLYAPREDLPEHEAEGGTRP